MPRSNLKGAITFGLVSIPVIFYTAADKTQKVSFHQIDKRNRARIKYERVNAITGKKVPWDDVVKGYQYTKEDMLVIEEGDLDKIAGGNARNIEIESFIPANDIDLVDVDRTYYLAPDKKGEKGYVILREALLKAKKMGIARVVISTKEYVAAVGVYKDALVLHLLHYFEEIRPLEELDIPADNLRKYHVSTKEIEVARQLIQSMSKKWNPKQYKDEYKKMVQQWIERKAKKLPHAKAKPGKTAATGKSVNFVDLLKKSLANSKVTPTKKKNGKTKKAMPYARVKTGNGKHATRH